LGSTFSLQDYILFFGFLRIVSVNSCSRSMHNLSTSLPTEPIIYCSIFELLANYEKTMIYNFNYC